MTRTLPLSPLVLALTLTLTLAAGPALAQLGQGGTGAAGGADAGVATPQVLPELPDADYQFAFEGTGTNRRAASHFSVVEDTPAFGNGSELARFCHEGGVCHGLTHLVLDWYTRVLVPIRLQTDWFGETEVSGVMCLNRIVTAANIEDNRLRAFTRVAAQKRNAVRWAIHLQTCQSYVSPAWDVGASGHNAEHLQELALADIANERRGVVPMTIYGQGYENDDNVIRHAVLLTSATDGYASAGNGRQERVTRFRIWDPNMVETREKLAEHGNRNYVMYFQRAKKLGFPRAYVQYYKDNTNCSPLQVGPFMPDDCLSYKNLHKGTAGRAALEDSLIFRVPGRISCHDDQLDWPQEDTAN